MPVAWSRDIRCFPNATEGLATPPEIGKSSCNWVRGRKETLRLSRADEVISMPTRFCSRQRAHSIIVTMANERMSGPHIVVTTLAMHVRALKTHHDGRSQLTFFSAFGSLLLLSLCSTASFGIV